jgi:hypothetical protein
MSPVKETDRCFKFGEKMDAHSMRCTGTSSITKHHHDRWMTRNSNAHTTSTHADTRAHAQVDAMAETFEKPLAARIASCPELPLSNSDQSSHGALF